MYEELFPPRQIRQVRPEDSVDEVLDAMAQVGADIRKDAEVTVKVTFHGPIAPDDNGEPFVRYFPDTETWERVRQHLNWTDAAIEVESVHGVMKPDGQFVATSG